MRESGCMTKIALRFLALAALGIRPAVAQQNDTPLPQLNDARVTIPYQELKALWQAAHREGKTEKPQPPVAASLLGARYDITLHADHAEGVAEFDVQSFTDRWTAIPLLGADAQIDAIEPEGAQVIVQDGHSTLITNSAGKSSVRIHFAEKFTTEGPGAAFKLRTPRALVNVLSVAGIPDDKTLRVAGAIPISSGKNAVKYRLPAQDQIEIAIVSAKTIEPPVPSKWKTETQAFVRFADGKLNYHAHIAAHADSGSGMSAEWRLPAAVRVVKVEGDDVADWSVTNPDDQTRRLQVRWKTRDVLARELELIYELPQSFAEGEWKLRAPEIEGGEPGSAVFAITAGDGIEFAAAHPAPAGRRIQRWLAATAEHENFVVVEADGAVLAKLLPLIHTTPAVIDRAECATRLVADGSLLSETSYTVRHDAPFAWQIHLPKGSALLACAVDGRQTSPIRRADDLLELPLPAPGEKELTEIKISYTARKPAFKPVSGQVEVELPQTELLIHKLDWELHIPAAYELSALQGNVESVVAQGKPDDTSRVIHLRKELCKGEAPVAQIFYQKPEATK